jgi:iron(III) transport system substrate-binding protein
MGRPVRLGLRRRSGRTVVVLALAFLSCSERTQKREKLTVYCSATLEWCELIARTWEQKSGVQVSMTRKSAGETLAQVTAERRNPRGDVWFGGTGDAHLQAAEAQLTEPYRSPHVDALFPWAIDPAGKGEHRTTGIYLGALGFSYNPEWLAKTGLPAPKGWKDLAGPNFKGEVQVANPNSSGTAYTMLATQVQLFGEEEAFAWLKALHANVNQYTLSGAAPARAVARGETGVGIAFLHDALTEKLAGFPVVLVVPEEGTGYETGCVSIIHGARHLENARAFVDWTLTPQAQATMEKGHSYQWPSNKNAPLPTVVGPLEQLNLMKFDLQKFGTKAERKRLLTRWETEVRGGG